MNATAFEILKLLIKYETLAPKDMADLTGVSQTYLHKTLNELHNRKFIVYNDLSGSHRVLNSDHPFIIKLREFFAVELETRMRIDILSKRNLRKIVRCFYSEQVITAKHIAQATGLSYITVSNALKRLIDAYIIQQMEGNHRPYKYSLISSAKNKLFLELSYLLEDNSWDLKKQAGYEELRQMLLKNCKVHVLVLYGSASFGMADDKSDIDLFVVVSDRQTYEEIKSIEHDPKVELNVLLIENLASFAKKQPQFISQLLHSDILKGKNVIESICES